MRRLVAALAGGFMLLAGVAAHAAEKVMYQEITDNKPEVGVSAMVYLGDRMLEQRRGQYHECVVPKFSSDKKILSGHFLIKAGEPLCKLDPRKAKYAAKYDNIYNTFDNSSHKSDISLKEVGKDLKLCSESLCTDPFDKSQIDGTPYFLYSINTIQQTIEYSGRSGNILKFIYSEFYDGYARQAFTREFQVDLNEGKVAGYKGAIIEIESATNSSITYKVVRNFQQ